MSGGLIDCRLAEAVADGVGACEESGGCVGYLRGECLSIRSGVDLGEIEGLRDS